MELLSFCLGIILAVLFGPIAFILIVSIRRSILDGAKLDDLSKRYILITGSSSGFGLDLTKRLDSLGCPVIATCRTEAGVQKLKEQVSSRVIAMQMDVSDVKSIESVEKRVREILPRPDSLWAIVNNAGIFGAPMPADLVTVEDMKHTSDVNLWGAVAVTKTFLSYLKKSKGRIINASSIVGRLASPDTSAYSISKYGIEAFSDCLRQEVSRFGISVHVMEISIFKTAMADVDRLVKEIRESWDKQPIERRKEYGDEWLLQELSDIKRLAEECDPNIQNVSDSLEHALFSSKPKNRYFPGFSSSFLVWWISLLPADISDWIQSKMY